MGKEYDRVFGSRAWEVITDGVDSSELIRVRREEDGQLIVYFAGMLHIEYQPLFNCLAEALDIIASKGKNVLLRLRGTPQMRSLNGRRFTVEYLPVTVDAKVLKTELDLAHVLYLPIKFSDPYFYRYSLSTKMVGYLGAPGAILFHGPADSAACGLLQMHKCAAICNSLKADHLVEVFQYAIDNGLELSTNAKDLASRNFDLARNRNIFWKNAADRPAELAEIDGTSLP